MARAFAKFFRRHQKLSALLLVLSSTLLAFLTIELATRLFISPPAPYVLEAGYMELDKRGFWSMRPGLHTTMDNRVDFRRKPLTIGPEGARQLPCASGAQHAANRVYLLGDSQTFGWGLADGETWANRLQCRLNRMLPGRFQVISLGVPGTQAEQYWSRGLKQVAPAMRAGDIVVTSLTWNDLLNFYTGDKFVAAALAEAGLEETKSVDGVATVRELNPNRPSIDASPRINVPAPIVYVPRDTPVRLPAPTWRSRLYARTGVFIPSFASALDFVTSVGNISAAAHFLLPKIRLLYYRLRPDSAFFKKFSKRGIDQNFLVLKSLDSIVQQKSGKLIVQLFPNRLFFDDYYYDAYSKTGAVFPERDYLGFVSAPRCKSLALHCVNRFGDLKTTARDANSYGFDGHYNAAGAAKIAEALARDIVGSVRGD